MPVFYLVSMLLLPLLMLGTGLLIRSWAPKSINYLFRYRTPRSTKNQETWNFANQTMARIWIRWGLYLLLLSLLLSLLVREAALQERLSVIVPLLHLVPLILSIVPVERALKKCFDEKGRRREE